MTPQEIAATWRAAEEAMVRASGLARAAQAPGASDRVALRRQHEAAVAEARRLAAAARHAIRAEEPETALAVGDRVAWIGDSGRRVEGVIVRLYTEAIVDGFTLRAEPYAVVDLGDALGPAWRERCVRVSKVTRVEEVAA